MKKNFLSINIPQLAVLKTDEAINIIKKNINSLKEWKEISELIPKKFIKEKNLIRTG